MYKLVLSCMVVVTCLLYDRQYRYYTHLINLSLILLYTYIWINFKALVIMYLSVHHYRCHTCKSEPACFLNNNNMKETFSTVVTVRSDGYDSCNRTLPSHITLPIMHNAFAKYYRSTRYNYYMHASHRIYCSSQQ